MKRLLLAVVGRWYRWRVRVENVRRRSSLEAFCPGILQAFDEIETHTGTTGTHVAKCWELLSLLQRHQPTVIAEMGSGRTSLLFAAYAKRSTCRYVAFEQDSAWQALINQLTMRLSDCAPVQHVPAADVLGKGGRYVASVPPDADFVYIDGPFTPGLAFPTFSGKAAAMDVPLWLANGGRPRVIVVDDRTDTVDELLAFPGYGFNGGWLWTQERRVLAHILRPRRHSVFVAATGSADSTPTRVTVPTKRAS